MTRNQEKKVKTSKSSGDGKPSASSSGPATAEEEVPRRRGGVPMAMDSGDKIPETAKRNIGESEPGESEDSKDKKGQDGK